MCHGRRSAVSKHAGPSETIMFVCLLDTECAANIHPASFHVVWQNLNLCKRKIFAILRVWISSWTPFTGTGVLHPVSNTARFTCSFLILSISRKWKSQQLRFVALRLDFGACIFNSVSVICCSLIARKIKYWWAAFSRLSGLWPTTQNTQLCAHSSHILIWQNCRIESSPWNNTKPPF